MAAPSVTYSFTNGTTADASQVNQNFTDVLNGITDGTKDLTIADFSCDDFTNSGNTTIGSGSADDLTINASLASSIVIKTTFSYDVGSATIGLKSIYLGSNDSAARSVRLIAPAVPSSYTYTLPTSGGTSRYRQLTNGSGTQSFEETRGLGNLVNIGLTASVAGNALTIALKGANGSDPSSTNVVEATFRHATVTTGTPQLRTATAATSLTVSSGSTLGFASGATHYSYVYLLDNAGTLELGIAGVMLDEGTVQSSTAEGGAGAADSIRTLYSTTARANVAIRLIARLKHSLTTAGTWDEVPDEITLAPWAPERPIALYETAQARSITDATATTGEFLTEVKVLDSHNSFNTTTAIYTCSMAGPWEVSAMCSLGNASSWDNNDAVELQLFKNGSLNRALGRLFVAGISGVTAVMGTSGSCPVSCAAGDTLEVRILLSVGAGKSLNTTAAENWVAFKYLGPIAA